MATAFYLITRLRNILSHITSHLLRCLGAPRQNIPVYKNPLPAMGMEAVVHARILEFCVESFGPKCC